MESPLLARGRERHWWERFPWLLPVCAADVLLPWSPLKPFLIDGGFILVFGLMLTDFALGRSTLTLSPDGALESGLTRFDGRTLTLASYDGKTLRLFAGGAERLSLRPGRWDDWELRRLLNALRRLNPSLQVEPAAEPLFRLAEPPPPEPPPANAP